MIAFASMLVHPAQEAGIRVPPNPERYWRKKWIKWHVFLNVQLGASLPFPSAHWENAKIIAGIDEDRLKRMTFADLIAVGLHVST